MSEVVKKELPEKWDWATFGDVADLLRGVSYKKGDASSEPVAGKVPVLRANNIGDGLDFDSLVYVPEKQVKEEQYIRKGDIIIAMSSGSKHLVGKAAQANDDFKGAYGAFCANLRVTADVDPKYVAYYYSSQDNLKRISGSSKGSNINNLKREHVLGAPIPIAPPEQQKRIVAKIEELFSHIDAGIEALKKVKQLLKQYRQSVLKAAVTGELTKEWREANKDKLEPVAQLLERLKKEREEEVERLMSEWQLDLTNWKKSGEKGKKPGRPKKLNMELDISKNVSQDNYCIPREWIKINLDFAVSKLGDGIHGTPKYSDGEYYFINGNNLNSGNILIKPETKTISKDEAEKHRRELNDRTVLVSINGTLGNIAFYEGEKVILGKSACYLNILPSLSKNYIRWVLESNEFKLYAEKTATGSTIKNIPLKAMREFIIPLCSPNEQNEIVRLVEEKLSSIEHLDAELGQQLIKAETNKQSVLASAFLGKLV